MTQIGNDLPNVLIGSGIDTLFGLGEGDGLTGSQDGKGLMNGNAGNDTLRSRSPEDTMYGGQGNDVLISSGGSLMFGDLGDDTLVGEGVVSVFGGGQGGSDTMNGGSGADSLVAAAGGNTLMFGNAGNDTLLAKSGSDTLFGGQGDDCLEVGSFAVLAYGDLGSDKLLSMGSNGGATLFGGSSDADKNTEDGDDTITSQGGGNLLFGNGGNDVLSGSTGDTLRGGQDNDTITATGAQVFGDFGDDVILGSGISTLNGGAGSDTLTAFGSGNMLMDGGSEANTFVLGAGATDNLVMLTPGNGSQLVNALAAGSGNTINGAASNGNNIISSNGNNLILLGSGAETVNAQPTDTVIGAVSGVDLILGGPVLGSASGFITGDAGSNVLQGGTGADTIEGLGGSDTLTGGAGRDVFLFRGDSLSDVGIGSFNGGTVTGTAQIFNYAYGLPTQQALDELGSGVTFTTDPTSTFYSIIGTVAYGTSTAIPNGTVNYVGGVPVFQFIDSQGTAVFIDTTPGAAAADAIRGNRDFTVDPQPAFGESAVLVKQGGTNVVVPDAAFFRRQAADAPDNTGGQFAGAGYGYSTSGFDVITDFERGTDKIVIEASMLAANLTAGATVGTASAASGVFQDTNLAYDKNTGILYFLPAGNTDIGTVPTYSTEPLFQQARFGIQVNDASAGTNLPLDIFDAGAFGTAGTGVNFAGALAPTTQGTVVIQTRYTFAPTGSTVIAIQDGDGGALNAASAGNIPIPFLQVLNAGLPVAQDLTVNDISVAIF